MQSVLSTARRTAVVAALALAVAGSGAASAVASPQPTGADALERVLGDGVRSATAKEKRQIRRQADRAGKAGDETRKAKRRLSSRYGYRPLGCLNVRIGTICGYNAYFDVSIVASWNNGTMTLGWISVSQWNTLVYYFA